MKINPSQFFGGKLSCCRSLSHVAHDENLSESARRARADPAARAATEPRALRAPWGGSMDFHGPEISRICSSSEISRFWCAGARLGENFAHLPSPRTYSAVCALRPARAPHLDRYRTVYMEVKMEAAAT